MWNDFIQKKQKQMQNYERVYFPQMWSMKTDAMNKRDITNTGTGPLKQRNYLLLTLNYTLKLML